MESWAMYALEHVASEREIITRNTTIRSVSYNLLVHKLFAWDFPILCGQMSDARFASNRPKLPSHQLRINNRKINIIRFCVKKSTHNVYGCKSAYVRMAHRIHWMRQSLVGMVQCELWVRLKIETMGNRDNVAWASSSYYPNLPQFGLSRVINQYLTYGV